MQGFYIGRFQPYHDGHHRMVEEITAEVNEFVLGIGSTGDSHSPRDPSTTGERVIMVNKAVSNFDITTYAVPIEDLDRNSMQVSHVQSMPLAFEVAYSNNPLVIQLFIKAGVEVHQSPMFNREMPEGMEVRQCMIEDHDWESLVPDEVIDVVREIDSIERLRRVTVTDGTERVDGDRDPNPC